MQEGNKLGFSYLRTISLLTLLTLFSKLFGVFRELLLAWNFGDGAQIAALGIANGINGTIFGALTATVAVAALPIFTELKIKQGMTKAIEFLGNLLTILLGGAFLLMVLFWLAAEPLTMLFAGGFSADPETFMLTVTMLRIVLFSVYFQIASSVFTIYLQSERKLVQILLANMSFNIAHISCTLLAVRYGPSWLAQSAVLGAMLTCLLLLLMARCFGFMPRLHIDLSDPSMKRVMVIMLPVWIGMGVGTLNVMVDRSIASYLGVEAVSSIDWAHKTLSSAASFFVPTIVMIINPLFAESAVHSIEQLLESFRKAVSYIILFLAPVALGAAMVAQNAIGVLYGYGAFDNAAVMRTAWAMICYAPNALLFGVVNDAVYRYFVARQDTFTPMRNGIAALCTNIVLNLILAPFMGVAGLALASTVATLLSIFLGVRQMHKTHGAIGGKVMLNASLWVLGASLGMIIPVVAISAFVVPTLILRWHRLLILLTQVALGGAVYFAIISRSPIAEVAELKAILMARFKSQSI